MSAVNKPVDEMTEQELDATAEEIYARLDRNPSVPLTNEELDILVAAHNNGGICPIW